MKWDESLYIEPVKTHISETDAVMHLRESWKKFYGKYPDINSLSILWSQTILETGRFKSSYCYNVGNEKSKPGDGHHWTMYSCSEILKGPDGKRREYFFDPPHDQCKFRAFESAQEGFDHYFKFVATRERYKAAWSQVLKGDVVEYTKELKKAGYFTASLDLYLKGMTRLNAEFHRRASELLGGGDKVESPENIEDMFTDEEKHEISMLVSSTTADAVHRYFSLSDRSPDEDSRMDSIAPVEVSTFPPPESLPSAPDVVPSVQVAPPDPELPPKAAGNKTGIAIVAAVIAAIAYILSRISDFF